MSMALILQQLSLSWRRQKNRWCPSHCHLTADGAGPMLLFPPPALLWLRAPSAHSAGTALHLLLCVPSVVKGTQQEPSPLPVCLAPEWEPRSLSMATSPDQRSQVTTRNLQEPCFRVAGKRGTLGEESGLQRPTNPGSLPALCLLVLCRVKVQVDGI